MDLLSQLVGKSTSKKISNETDPEEVGTPASTSTIPDVNKPDGFKMHESDVNNKIDVKIAEGNVICKTEELNMENGDSSKSGIVENFMLKVFLSISKK